MTKVGSMHSIGTDVEELDHMAGGKGQAFIAKSFDELIGDQFVTQLTDKVCEKGMKI